MKKAYSPLNTPGSVPAYNRISLLIAIILIIHPKINFIAQNDTLPRDPFLKYNIYFSRPDDNIISREKYFDRFQGFWLGECIANWTGLVTEMDKIGNIGEIKTGEFYTRDDWGKPDKPSIWGNGTPSALSPTIEFVLKGTDEIWGADDDTDIEYMYQHLMYENKTPILTPQMIKDGWLKHVIPEEENYLWVSNQKAFDLMHEGYLPPSTGRKENNSESDMIDAQLTTEIFGLFSPGFPSTALKMAYLPIRTVADGESVSIAEFYAVMHSLALAFPDSLHISQRIIRMADAARNLLSEDEYPAKMYDFVKNQFENGTPWEMVRDSIYTRYQVEQRDGYNITSRDLYCNGCFAAGINFAASLVSLFYGKGDLKETIKIGALVGWDSDNPTATWGGLLGFIYGRKEIEKIFGQKFSDKFNIHRTRQNFPVGIDTFGEIAKRGVFITDRVTQELNGGGTDSTGRFWSFPPQSDNY